MARASTTFQIIVPVGSLQRRLLCWRAWTLSRPNPCVFFARARVCVCVCTFEYEPVRTPTVFRSATKSGRQSVQLRGPKCPDLSNLVALSGHASGLTSYCRPLNAVKRIIPKIKAMYT